MPQRPAEAAGREGGYAVAETERLPVPDPCLLVIFGASGDLTRRKLVPALLELHREQLLPGEFAVLGVSRTPYTDASFRDLLAAAAREELGHGFDGCRPHGSVKESPHAGAVVSQKSLDQVAQCRIARAQLVEQCRATLRLRFRHGVEDLFRAG